MKEEVKLIPMTPELYHAYCQTYENDPDLYLDKTKCEPYVYSRELADRFIRHQNQPDRLWFAIRYGDETVGEVILKRIEPRKSATLGICMKNPRCKDRGFGTAAERLAIDYVFRELDIPVLYADTILTNTRSQHVLEKVGFRFLREEGDFRYYCIQREPAEEAPGDP